MSRGFGADFGRTDLDALCGLCYDDAVTKQPDYYKILQVDPEAEPEVVTAAYRRLASKYHPDVNSASDAEERMRDLNQAYSVINDASKRSDYDRQRLARARATRVTPSRGSYYATRRTMPMVTVTPSILSFGTLAKGTTRTLTVEISVTEGRTLIGDLRVSHPWIHLSTTRLFSATTVVNVEVDTTLLKEGATHNGALIIDSISYGTRSVPISVQVGVVEKPVLIATPSILDFGVAVTGRSPKVLSIRLSNGGSGVLIGTIASRHKWLCLSESSWSGNTMVVQAIADPGGLKSGRVYQGEIDITSNGGRFVVLARMHVVASEMLVDLDADQTSPTRDLDFLRERMVILRDVRKLTALQESEQLVIGALMQVCKGGDVAVTLQRAIEGAQGWRDQAYLADGIPLSENLLPVLNDLFLRLRRWETHEG
jgi:hypothetical protein